MLSRIGGKDTLKRLLFRPLRVPQDIVRAGTPMVLGLSFSPHLVPDLPTGSRIASNWGRGFAAGTSGDGDTSKGSIAFSSMTKENFDESFRGRACVTSSTITEVDVVTDGDVLAVLMKELGMGLANAAFFVLPSTERSLLFYAYEILGAFARFSGKLGLPESELQLALVDAAEPEAPQVDRRLFSGYLSELTLKVEDILSKAEDKLPARGFVELVVYQSKPHVARLLLEMKKDLKKERSKKEAQLWAELVILSEKNFMAQGEKCTWGVLTDIRSWIFVKATTERGDAGTLFTELTHVKDLQFLEKQSLAKGALEVISLLLSILFPGATRNFCTFYGRSHKPCLTR